MSRTIQNEGWRELGSSEALALSPTLLQCGIPLFQLPFWTEPLKVMHLRPRYLEYTVEGQPRCFASLLTVPLPGFAIGLVHRGPTPLGSDFELNQDVFEQLNECAARIGLIAVRYTGTEQSTILQLRDQHDARACDPFPYYQDLDEELIVPISSDEEVLLLSFDRGVRRKVKKARGQGYCISRTKDPQEFVKIWPLFRNLGIRKGFSHRPLKSYVDLIRLAGEVGCVQLYTANIDGKDIASLLLLKDKTTAYYISGALDIDSLAKRESPVPLLVLTAMLDAAAAGIQYFHLGSRSGQVHRFKAQFCPTERRVFGPATVILAPLRFELWDRTVVRWSPRIKGRLKKLLSR